MPSAEGLREEVINEFLKRVRSGGDLGEDAVLALEKLAAEGELSDSPRVLAALRALPEEDHANP